MNDSDLSKWFYTEHTRVKHEILEKYLGGWLYILGSWHKRFFILDGFAGRGEYTGGSQGSPIIIMSKAEELIAQNRVSEVICGFVERDPDNFDNLQTVIKRVEPHYPNVKVLSPKNSEFEDVANDAVLWLERKPMPSFWFIDPFGFTGMSFDTIKSIMALDRSEVFITLMVRDMRRFLNLPSLGDTYAQLFATDEWRHFVSSRPPQETVEDRLRDFYVAQLRSIGCKVTVFRNSEDNRRQTLYYLVHATKHPRGRWLMKDIMHAQGVNGVFEYLGPDDPSMRLQGVLMPVENLPDLKVQLLDKLAGQILSFDGLLDECCDDNELRIPDYRTALQELRREGLISVNPVTSKTDRGLSGRDVITFPPN